MFATPPEGGALFVEPLESRIAPTTLFANDPAVSSNPDYVTFDSAPTAHRPGFVHGTKYGVAGSDVYALKLTAGDKLLIFNSATGFDGNPFLQVTKGSLVAFFRDTDGGVQVQSNELVGLSLAGGTSAEVNGNVNGDIVTNLSKAGTITLNSVGATTQSIAGLNIVGNVTGSIVSGGNIAGVTVSGSVEDVLAGSAVNGYVYHFGDPTVATGTLTANPIAAGKVGASIDNMSLLTVGVIRAGHGGLEAAGGSVSNVTLQSDTAGFSIFSGPGGHGTVKVAAGAGGAISGITAKGVTDATENSSIHLQAGNGGPDRGGSAGAGGTISDVAISFNNPVKGAGSPTLSTALLDDDIFLHAGNGGLGLRGGTGGSVNDSFLDRALPSTGAPDIMVLAGNGGAAAHPSTGHGGLGGSINGVSAKYLDTNADTTEVTVTNSSILIEAGAAGAGEAGGNVSGVSLLGAILTVEGGAGGGGRAIGGQGGSIDTVSANSNSGVTPTSLTLDAGVGGPGRAGGAGGSITTVNVGSSDLSSLVIDGGTHANGGLGSGGIGGAGGSVSGVSINDNVAGPLGTVAVRTGTGGNGFLGGGAGGGLGTSQAPVQILGTDFTYDLVTGAGGNVLANGHGAGGAGGDFNTVGVTNESFNTAGILVTNGATGTATSGAGGSGSKGGKGGDLMAVDLTASVDVLLQSGNGGKGIRLAAGAGGSIFNSAGVSLFSSVSALSGNGGTAGGAPGAGGSITSFIASAAYDVRFASGNGTFGGAGGNISTSGTALNEITEESNTGVLTVTAGRGSSANGVGGAGGSIDVFNGSIGQSGTTAFTAGAGGGGTHKAASGAGGSIDSVTLTGANGVATNHVVVTFDGGNAGVAGRAKVGAVGGSVSNVTISNLAVGTVVQHVAAGDGGRGNNIGGMGGSVNQIHVGAPGDADLDTADDIGVISGLDYGYAVGTAGGIFAGVGGTGGKTGGSAGNVTNITAHAIASIAAGKSTTAHLAHKVDAIYLIGLVASAADVNGAFTNFGSANLVGSVINPTANHASTYETGDGLIAAAIITFGRNFVPEAELTRNASGQLELVDYRQPSKVPVVTPVG